MSISSFIPILVLGVLIFGIPIGILLFLLFGNPSKEFLDGIKNYNPPGWK